MLFLIGLLPLISFSSGVRIENLDDEIDFYIDNLINPGISLLTYDVFGLPEFQGNNSNLKYSLSGGTLKVKPVIRTGSWVLMIEDNQMFFNASIGLQELEMNYRVKIAYGIITLNYNLEVSITRLSQEADFLIVHQDGQSCSATITNARFQIGNIHVKLHGQSSEIYNSLLKLLLERGESKSKMIDFVNAKTGLYLIHFNKHLVFNCYKMFTP